MEEENKVEQIQGQEANGHDTEKKQEAANNQANEMSYHNYYIGLFKELQNEITQIKIFINQNTKDEEINLLKNEIVDLKKVQIESNKEIILLKNEIENFKKVQENSNQEIILLKSETEKLKSEIEKLKQNKTVVNPPQDAKDKAPPPEEEQLSEVDQFKKKYNIRENSSEIEIYNKHIGDNGVKILLEIPQNRLKTLNLYGNDIKDITFLSKINVEKLERLYLYNNKITDIKIFEQLNLSNLLELCLDNNYFKDISVLEKMNCIKLHKLFLSATKITDISVLERVNFPELVKLDLSNNNIKDISVFEKKKFDRLTLLNISENQVNYSDPKNKNLVRCLKQIIEEFEY